MSWMIDPCFALDWTACAISPLRSPHRRWLTWVSLLTLSRGTPPMSAGVKVAMIVSQPIAFGVARQFASLAEAAPLEVQLFRDRDSAMSWLIAGSNRRPSLPIQHIYFLVTVSGLLARR
jgi:hypothetical protein